MINRILIGAIGPGDSATPLDLELAYQLGQLIAQAGWVLLTGGRNVGVMDAASQGAKAANGLTVGILPDADVSQMSSAIDIAIATDLGSARNNINVLSSAVIIACGMGAGTASEVALALKAKKKVILLNSNNNSQEFFRELAPQNVFIVKSPAEAIALVREFIATSHPRK